MAEQDGLWLVPYIEPQLLEEAVNYNDDFIAALGKPDAKAIGKDGIYFNKLNNNVGFKVNASTDFTPAQMTGKKNMVPWDKLDTTPTNITDKEMRALAFDKESEVRKKQMAAWKLGVRGYTVSKIAPKQHASGKMPVIRTTGEVINGRKRLKSQDLYNFYEEIEALKLADPNGFHFVLNSTHRADLMYEKSKTSNHWDIEFDPITGKVKRFYKFNLWENLDTANYTAEGVLKSLGSLPTEGDQSASVFFYAPNTVYHIEDLLVLYKEMKTDTRSVDPQSEIRLHTYGLCDKKQEHGFGALVSDNA
ncbi:hypothetical protein [Epilithonimonas mollis]|uniref:Uncharacterized protein n=1 Tax=Epilithonimonas mollis TaxID=216903 RepID=A0A1M6UKC6_9FLAO|nr:hypothetical protein [Epilithonimonas mollis]SHK69672.1 hypothetical protein SAMN05444371_3350 [Epilithonimonas mollis]